MITPEDAYELLEAIAMISGLQDRVSLHTTESWYVILRKEHSGNN